MQKGSLRCAFRQDDTENKLLILHALGLLGTLHEGNLEHVTISSLELPQVILELRVPPDLEAVLPAAKDWVARLQLQQRLLAVDGPEPGSADVSDVIDEVGIRTAERDWVVELLERRRGRVVVLHLLPCNAGELVLERGATVLEPVTLLGCEISAPVADFNVTLQEGSMEQWLGEVVSYGNLLLRSSRHLGIRTVRQAGSLFLGVILALLVLTHNGILRGVGGWELELSLLLQRSVGRRGVGVQVDLHVLLVALAFDACRDRVEGSQDRVRDGEGDLVGRGEWRGQLDEVILDRAV